MALKFLADENVSTYVVKSLRHKGYDTKDIKEEKLFGISDREVLSIAVQDNRTVITHDKDFANLINYKQEKHKGVILLRLKNQTPENVVKIFIPILENIEESKIKKSL